MNNDQTNNDGGKFQKYRGPRSYYGDFRSVFQNPGVSHRRCQHNHYFINYNEGSLRSCKSGTLQVM